MDQWKKFTSNVGPQFQNIGKTFGNPQPAAPRALRRRRPGGHHRAAQEYKDLERRVDALKAAHTGLMKVAKVYETESYD